MSIPTCKNEFNKSGPLMLLLDVDDKEDNSDKKQSKPFIHRLRDEFQESKGSLLNRYESIENH